MPNFKSPHPNTTRKGSVDLAGNMIVQNNRSEAKRQDSHSEIRSIYKLDPNVAPILPSRAAASNFSASHHSGLYPSTHQRTVPGQGPNIEQLFQRLGAEEKSLILDKIHNKRMKAYDLRDYENLAKPHMPGNNPHEKEKIVEQYFMAKR